MKCNSCLVPRNGKCPQDCLEKLFCTTLDSKGYITRKNDDTWCEDVYDFSMEVWLLTEESDPMEIEETIERVCKDHSSKWFQFLQAPLIYDVTRRYGEMIRQQQDRDGQYDGSK